MRKFMYFAAALLVLVGCNKKDNALNNAPEGTPFEKGQQVTLTVGTGAQQGPNKVAGVDNTAGTQIDFTWEEGDKILVKVDDKTAVFTLTTGAGTNSAEFAGEMPAAGSSFDIQYPVNTPDLTAGQVCPPIPANKMLFTATGCTLGESASLAAQYAMVQLNLYGTDITIGQIVLTNTTADPVESYPLFCGYGMTIGTTLETAIPFYMVVPAGVYQFEVEVYDNADEPAKICSFATSAAQTFTAGKCLNMPAKEVKVPFIPTYVDLGLSVKWATCNVGATKPEEFGYYLAWGETSPKEVYDWDTYFDSDEAYGRETDYFGKYHNYGGLTTLEPEDDAAHVNWGGNWRMPTQAEFEELVNTQNCKWDWQENYSETGVKGYLVTSLKEDYTDNSIFLPGSGCRYESSGTGFGSSGYYWSSSLRVNNSDHAHYLYFYSGYVAWDGYNHRCNGLPVRPVCQ